MSNTTMYCAAPTPMICELDGSVSVTGSKATITLSACTSGSFECQLDGGSYMPCKYSKLWHCWYGA